MTEISIWPVRIKLSARVVLNIQEAARGRYQAVWVARLDCRRPGSPVHSNDRIKLYTGRERPLRWCGFHASMLGQRI